VGDLAAAFALFERGFRRKVSPGKLITYEAGLNFRGKMGYKN
jgi:hypothetical protein